MIVIFSLPCSTNAAVISDLRQFTSLKFHFSALAGLLDDERRRLLHCVVIGGGPTGVEFSGELSDFIMRDVHERYAHVESYIHVTLIEVMH